MWRELSPIHLSHILWTTSIAEFPKKLWNNLLESFKTFIINMLYHELFTTQLNLHICFHCILMKPFFFVLSETINMNRPLFRCYSLRQSRMYQLCSLRKCKFNNDNINVISWFNSWTRTCLSSCTVKKCNHTEKIILCKLIKQSNYCIHFSIAQSKQNPASNLLQSCQHNWMVYSILSWAVMQIAHMVAQGTDGGSKCTWWL